MSQKIAVIAPQEIISFSGVAQFPSLTIGAPECDERERQQKLRPLRRFLLSTGLYFIEEKRRPWLIVRILLAIIFIVITILHWGWFLHALVYFNKQQALAIIILILNTNSAIVRFYFCYWQCRGHFSALLSSVAKSKLNKKQIGRIQTLVAFMIMIFIEFLFETLNFWLEQTGLLHFEDSRESVRKMGSWSAPRIAFFVDFMHAEYVNVVIMVFYNVLIRILIAELDKLDARGKQSDLDDAGLADICEQYLSVVRRVRELDEIFQVFLFLMVATNIPMTVSTLLRMFFRLRNWCWLQFSILSSDLLSCLFNLIGLTAMAAKLRSKLIQLPANLSEQTKVNHLMDANLQGQIRCLLSRMSNQTDLGISLWGFTIITKPLILTVLSIVATYLTVVLQFMQK